MSKQDFEEYKKELEADGFRYVGPIDKDSPIEAFLKNVVLDNNRKAIRVICFDTKIDKTYIDYTVLE